MSRFNERPALELLDAVTACLDIPRWVDAVIEGRPYRDVGDVLTVAEQAADPFTDEEVAHALAHHPRIGERASGNGAEAALSRREQSGVDPTDAEVTEMLRAGNHAYEERFGHVFLIRAAGRSAAQILAALEERLGHTPEQEREVMAAELRQIAVLRLREVLTR